MRELTGGASEGIPATFAVSGNVIDESEVLIDGPRASSEVEVEVVDDVVLVEGGGVANSSSLYIHWNPEAG